MFNVQFAIVVEADGHDLCRSVLDGSLVMVAGVNHWLESGKSSFGLCTLLVISGGSPPRASSSSFFKLEGSQPAKTKSGKSFKRTRSTASVAT
jgi:hypothetical protein